MIHPVDTLLALVLLSVSFPLGPADCRPDQGVAFQGMVVSIVPFFMGHDLTVGGTAFTIVPPW
jgi:hydrogenase-4 component E